MRGVFKTTAMRNEAIERNLERALFGENLNIYAILDGASIPELQHRLYEMQPPQVCLYRGELDADLAEVAPYLVQLSCGTRFTSWLLGECWGRHWGVFVNSPFSLVEMRKHFRRFLTVHDEAGNPMIFRFYDPRVLAKFLPTCEAEELTEVFAKVKHLYAESSAGENLVKMEISDEQLKQTHVAIKQSEMSFPLNGFQNNQVVGYSYA